MVISLRRLKSSALSVVVSRLVALLLFIFLGGAAQYAHAAVTLVQHTSRDAGTTTTNSLGFVSPNTAGNWIAVVIRAGSSSSQVFTVTDTNGNTYLRAFQLGLTANAITMAIYYAENIKGGANTVTVSDAVSGPFRVAILEYSGIATANSLDGAVTAQGASTTPSTANVNTTANGDLLLGQVVTNSTATFTAGAGYTIREFVPAEPNTKLIAEDQVQATAGAASASATLAVSDTWGAGLAAFKAAGGVAGSPASITASGGTPQSVTINTAFGTQLQATVKDSFNNPVSGVTVTFTAPSSGASGTFAGGANTATTNAQGVATAPVFTANSIAGAYTVTASAPGVTPTANFSLTNLAGAPASIGATAGTPQSATINTAFGTQLQATVKDGSNNPVNGVTVTFTAPASGASGTFAGGVNTATTNAQGVATAPVFTANGTAGGPYNVTASVAGVANSANFSLTNLASPPASITATAGTPQSATVNTPFATQLQVTVRDASNNPVNGVTVTFTAPASGASGTFAGGANTATTNAQGVATAAIFTANTTAGAYTVTASVAGVANPANFSLTNLAGAAASVTASGGTPQSAKINTAFATQLQATVTDSFSNPVSGVTVTFTAPASGASGTFAGGVNTATTNAQGVATAPVFTANGTAGGPYNVAASVAGVTTPANFSLTNAPPGSPITLVQHTSRDAGTTTTNALAFVSPNTAGNWIAVVIRAGSSSSQVFNVTDSNANTYRRAFQLGTTATSITFAIYYAENIKGGANTVTVSDTVSGPFRVAILEYSGIALSNSLDVTITAQGSSTSPTTGNVPTTANGDLLLGEVVTNSTATFTAGSGYTIRELVPAEPNTKLIAEDQIQAAAGTASATATLAVSDIWGAGLAAFKAATGVAGSPSTITATAGTPQSASINTAFAAQLQATIKDSFNNLVSGVTVTFTAPSSGASGTFAGGVNTATTNAQGVAIAAVFTANSIAGGPYNVAASVTGVATPANFSLTNLPGAPASVTATGGTPQSASINTAFTTQLQATVKDASNNPVSGVIVTFTAPSSGASGTFAGGVNTATTNAQGVATAPVFTANGTAGGPYNVTASVAGVATPASFSLTNNPPAAPSISTLSLTQGPVGAKVTITGSNFGAIQNSSSVTFNGIAATPTNWSASSIDVTVPSGATTGNVIVTVNSLASNGVNFTVTPPPNITSLSLNSGPVGALVTITGTNFGPTVGTISSFVTFNGTQGRSTSWSDTSISIPVPTGATSGNVVVFVGGVGSNGVPFTVTPPPSISSLNPTSGPVGTSVTISGSNFGTTAGTVTFNGASATVSTWADTSITAPVPAGATPGNVVVSVGGVPSNGVNFAVTSTTGNIALVQHTSRDFGSTTTGSLAFVSPNAAGNWIAVCVRAGNSNTQVFTISDTNGNTYRSALQVGIGATHVTFAIFYAENSKGGANTVTVSDTVSGPFRVAILEYSGVATANSLELTTSAQGGSTTPNSGPATTTSSGDLLLGVIVTTNPGTFTAGTGYTFEELVPAEPNTKLAVEDQLQRIAGSTSASATLAASDTWGAALAAFRSASGAALPLSVSVSPNTASVPTGYGTQSFSASLVNDFKNQGVTWALSGAGCSAATCGSLTNITTTSVTYNAPANVPNPATVTLTATAVADNTKTGSATITVIQGMINVTVSPKRSAVTLSQTQQFTATVTNDPSNSGVTWAVDGNSGGNATTGTVSNTGLYTPGTQPGLHNVTATSVANASISNTVTVAVTDLAGVYTYHYDTARTGQNLKEYALNTANVNSSTFGALFSCPVDGYIWAAPLYVANLPIGGQTHNVVFVATAHDSVYAFDADNPSCVQLWQVSFLSAGVTTVSPSDVNDANNDMFPEIGVTSTPVIDPATNTIYVEAKTKDTVSSGCTVSAPCYFHHLHALNILTGAENTGSPVNITAPSFDTRIHHQRPALLLSNGTVYIGFGSHGDRNSYQGWLMGYDASSLAQKFVFPVTNAAGNRGGVWQGGSGPAVDASGNVYILTGNGTYDGTNNWGDSALKFSPAGVKLDSFTPFDQSTLEANDIDFASSGLIILPDSIGSTAHPHLALATGKISILYLLDQTNMGGFHSSTNQDVQEVIPVPPPNTTQLDGGLFGAPAYWNGNIYTAGVNFPLSMFQIANGVISTPQSSKSANVFPLRGATPVVSANVATNGIVWILDLGAWPTNGPAILDAYDATDVSKLLYSSPSSGTGAAAPAVKFTVPTVANGKVYVPGEQQFTVFGLRAN